MANFQRGGGGRGGQGRGGGQGRSGGQGRGGGMGQERGVGRGGGRAAGPGGECVCTSCGATAPHQMGVPCMDMKCPKCGAAMTRKQA